MKMNKGSAYITKSVLFSQELSATCDMAWVKPTMAVVPTMPTTAMANAIGTPSAISTISAPKPSSPISNPLIGAPAGRSRRCHG